MQEWRSKEVLSDFHIVLESCVNSSRQLRSKILPFIVQHWRGKVEEEEHDIIELLV